MRSISVVINTYNRASSLPLTLAGLQHQDHDRFEVVVVNGPSTDGTDEFLRAWKGDIRVVDFSEVHLGKSRNVGIEAAAGELVAFIDDDAIPEPDWLTTLDAAFDDAEVGGAGGLVIDHTGYDLQYLYSIADRQSRTYFSDRPPNESSVVPGTSKFVYLQGTNNCFRRNVLLDIGGFDEEIEYFLDETEVCMQVIDRGYKLVQLLGGAVHHKYLASHLRTTDRVFTNPFAPVKNRTYFALQHGMNGADRASVLQFISSYVMELRSVADHLRHEDVFDPQQHAYFLGQVDDGFAIGFDRGIQGTRRSRQLPVADASKFVPYLTVRPANRRRVCFVSEEYPPAQCGGIGRYTHDLARELASRGHEIHVVTRSPDVSRIDFEDDVWVHRLVAPDASLVDLHHPLRHNLVHCANVYHEVRALHDRRPLDAVFSPIWNCEGFFTLFDDDLHSIVTLMTTVEKVISLMPSRAADAHAISLEQLETTMLGQCRSVHAISQAIWHENACRAPGAKMHLAELGAEDVGPELRARLADTGHSAPVILYVGRLEVRKGIPTLFDAAIEALTAHPDARLRLVGADTPNTEHPLTYREQLGRRLALRPDLLARIEFAGHVDDEDLKREYASASLLCVPSLFESFGLVVLEGMRAGIPVVGSDVGGMSEILASGGQIAVPPGDASALASALDRLLSDASLRAMLGKQARHAFEQQWTLGHAADRLELLLAEARPAACPPGSSRPDHRAVVRALRPLLGRSATAAVSQLLDPDRFGARTILNRLATARG